MLRKSLISVVLLFLSSVFLCCNKEQKGYYDSGYLINDDRTLALYADSLAKDPYRLSWNVEVWSYYTRTGDFRSLATSAKRAYYSDSDNNYLKVYGGVCAAQAYFFLENRDSTAFYLKDLSQFRSKYFNNTCNMLLNNIKGLYVKKYDLDDAGAIAYLKQALNYARKKGDQINVCMMLCNITSMYYSAKDTSGFEYALEAYEISKSLHSDYTLCFSSAFLAMMLNLKGDYSKAMDYACRALELAEADGYMMFLPNIYMILGDIYTGAGDYVRAEDNYLKSYSYSEFAEVSSYIELCCSYGSLLALTDRYAKSESVFNDGIRVSGENGSIEFLDDLYLGLSRLYEEEGKKEKALEYYKYHHQIRDSIIKKQYDSEFRYERSAHDSRMKSSMNVIYTVVSVLLFAVAACAVLIVKYRKKDRMYRQLVENHQQMMKTRENAKKQEVAEKSDQAMLPEDKANADLYAKITALMDEGLYRKADISLEGLSEILQTNRTYVSRVINKYSGKTFHNFINSYRIDEATKVLSNVKDETPLKMLSYNLGFNSTSVFCRVFQKDIGCSPSKYREQIRKINGGK